MQHARDDIEYAFVNYIPSGVRLPTSHLLVYFSCMCVLSQASEFSDCCFILCLTFSMIFWGSIRCLSYNAVGAMKFDNYNWECNSNMNLLRTISTYKVDLALWLGSNDVFA